MAYARDNKPVTCQDALNSRSVLPLWSHSFCGRYINPREGWYTLIKPLFDSDPFLRIQIVFQAWIVYLVRYIFHLIGCIRGGRTCSILLTQRRGSSPRPEVAIMNIILLCGIWSRRKLHRWILEATKCCDSSSCIMMASDFASSTIDCSESATDTVKVSLYSMYIWDARRCSTTKASLVAHFLALIT